jgi:signal transduction histidine kinase
MTRSVPKWLVEIGLVVVLAAIWIAEYAVLDDELRQLGPGSRQITLGLWKTSENIQVGLLVALLGVASLIVRDRRPLLALVLVSTSVIAVSWFYPLLYSDFAGALMLAVAAFWSVWKMPDWRIPAVLTVLVSGAVTIRTYQTSETLESITATASSELFSLTATARSLLFGVLAIAAGLLARRLDRQAAELVDRNRELEEQRDVTRQRAVLDERVRIARELHDVVAHHVATMTVHAGVARQLSGADGPAAPALSQIEDSGRAAIDDLHRLLGFLRGDDSDESEDRSPTPSLRALDRLMTSVPDLQVHTDLQGELHNLPDAVDLSAYRIIQESLTNAIKHSDSRRVDVRVERRNGHVEIEVQNSGPTRPGDGTGHGLLGMRERAALLGGSVTAGPDDAGGWMVTAHLPIDAPKGLPT